MAKRRTKKTNKMMRLSVIFVFTFVLMNVMYKTTLSQLNLEVERLKVAVSTQTNKNQSLAMKVNELEAPKNVQQVAQNLGLAYNNNNIRVVSE